MRARALCSTQQGYMLLFQKASADHCIYHFISTSSYPYPPHVLSPSVSVPLPRPSTFYSPSYAQQYAKPLLFMPCRVSSGIGRCPVAKATVLCHSQAPSLRCRIPTAPRRGRSMGSGALDLAAACASMCTFLSLHTMPPLLEHKLLGQLTHTVPPHRPAISEPVASVSFRLTSCRHWWPRNSPGSYQRSSDPASLHIAVSHKKCCSCVGSVLLFALTHFWILPSHPLLQHPSPTTICI